MNETHKWNKSSYPEIISVIKIESIELFSMHNQNGNQIRRAEQKDTELQEIQNALERGEKEMKGIALGLCQWKDRHLWYRKKISIPDDEGLTTTIISQYHDNSLAGHGGTAKTTELVSRRYDWPKMREIIKRYVKNSDKCQRSKPIRHAPYGLLQPNEVPEQPWRSIAMDFIRDLSESDGYDTILVVIDRLTKMSDFISCRKDLDARQFARLFMQHIVRLHRIPRDIITDRGSLFTSELWKQITEKLGIERRLSTAFHPQTDSQTERTNAILEKYLRAYVNYQQDNWNELLPLAEFAYNNGYQETIKTTPFYANYGRNPEHQLINHLMTEKETSAKDMESLHQTLREEMTTAQLRQKANYDKHRKPDPNLKSGGMVWFLPRNVKTMRPSKKLDYKTMGEFKIIKKVGMSSYKLDLPASMKFYNTFHISLLEPYEDNKFPSQIQTPPPPIEIEGEPEYEVEEIIDSRLHRNKLQYRAKWTGYSPEHDKTWYAAQNFQNASIAIERFHSRYSRKPGLGTRDHYQVNLRTSPPQRAENANTAASHRSRRM